MYLALKIGKVEIPITKSGYYLVTRVADGTAVDINNPRPSTTGFSYSLCPCQEGDIIEINGKGGSDPLLWAFVDNSYIPINPTAKEGEEASGLIKVAPANSAYIIINDKSGATSYISAQNSIESELKKKVDKVDGKGLSTNDYTDDDKSGLDEVVSKFPIKDNDITNDGILEESIGFIEKEENQLYDIKSNPPYAEKNTVLPTISISGRGFEAQMTSYGNAVIKLSNLVVGDTYKLLTYVTNHDEVRVYNEARSKPLSNNTNQGISLSTFVPEETTAYIVYGAHQNIVCEYLYIFKDALPSYIDLNTFEGSLDCKLSNNVKIDEDNCNFIEDIRGKNALILDKAYLTSNTDISNVEITLSGNSLIAKNTVKYYGLFFAMTTVAGEIYTMHWKQSGANEIRVYRADKTTAIVTTYPNETDLASGDRTFTALDSVSYLEIGMYGVDINAEELGVYKGQTSQSTFITKNMIDNGFVGKKFVTLGDSITQQEKWQKYVISTLGLGAFVNLGIGGTTIADNGTDNPFVSRVNTVNTDTKLLIVMGGTNDFGQSVPLGDTTYGTDGFDKSTFKGAIAYLITALQARIPDAMIFFANQVGGEGTTAGENMTQFVKNSLDLTPKDYADAMLDVCREFSVPCIDVFGESGINQFNRATYIADTVHPNASGGKLIAQVMIRNIRNSQLL